MMHTIYFLGYAVIATISAIAIIWAQYVRYKNEGIRFNFTLLKVVVGVALAMWTGAALTMYIYEPSTGTAALAAFSLGISFATFIALQMSKVIGKIQSSEKAFSEVPTHGAHHSVRLISA